MYVHAHLLDHLILVFDAQKDSSLEVSEGLVQKGHIFTRMQPFLGEISFIPFQTPNTQQPSFKGSCSSFNHDMTLMTYPDQFIEVTFILIVVLVICHSFYKLLLINLIVGPWARVEIMFLHLFNCTNHYKMYIPIVINYITFIHCHW